MPKFVFDLEYRGDAMGLVTTFRGSSGMVRLYADREESGRELSHAGGGGYDKRGTCFGEFLTDAFQPELRRIASRASSAYRRDRAGELHRIEPKRDADGRRPYDPRELYGMTAYRDSRGRVERVRLDGACGFESMVRIAEAIGLRVQFVAETRNTYVHLLTGLERIRKRRERAAKKAADARALESVPPSVGMHDRLPGGSTPEEWPA